GVCRDREPDRNGHAEGRHLGEADAFPSEKLPAASRILVEVVDETCAGQATIKAQGRRELVTNRRESPIVSPGDVSGEVQGDGKDCSTAGAERAERVRSGCA